MTQFREALDCLNQYGLGAVFEYYGHPDAVILALKIADRVMGEPSEGMIDAANQKMYMLPVYDMETATQTFKIGVRAMIDQMMRELEPSA